MNGLGAELSRALVGKTPKSIRAKRASKRTQRRRRMMMQEAAQWAATHEVDARPPTHLHQSMQEFRRADPSYFMEELLPQLMGVLPPPSAEVASTSFPRLVVWLFCKRPGD